jgi:hypothetical protein
MSLLEKLMSTNSEEDYVEYYKNIGKFALEEFENIAILEVGSGHCRTVPYLCSIESDIVYHSIDLKEFSTELPHYISHTHHKGCAFSEDTDNEIPIDFFNILIVDIEPHGSEVQLLKKYEKFMKNNYIVILKCVGCMMSLFNEQFGKAALSYLKYNHILIDYIANGDPFVNADIIVMCSRQPTSYEGTCSRKLSWRGNDRWLLS